MQQTKNTNSNWVYHEKQISLLCGQHCLNNLLQSPFFTAGDLADIAQILDSRERQYMLEAGNDTIEAIKYLAEESQNVDVSGNFSIEVLKMALGNFNIELVPWFPNKKGYSDNDPCDEIGFIVNHASHWFAIRRVNGNWWNLNSFNDKPTKISNFYLSAFLAQLVSDGYYVYIARGFVGDDNSNQFTSSQGLDNPSWHNMSQQSHSNSQQSQQQQQQHQYQGTGYKLGGESDNRSPNVNSDTIALDLTEEEQLQLALNLSMETNTNTDQIQQSEKEKLREKRLAALNK